MVTTDRRRKLTIEEVNVYWRALKEGTETARLHRLCNAIRTLDLALNESEPILSSRLSHHAWSRQRDDYFDLLLSSFPGYFIVYVEESGAPMEPETQWPERGFLEFYPEMVNRRDDAYRADLQRVHKTLLLRLRWSFAEGRQHTTPEDFSLFRECINQHDTEEDAEEAKLFLDQLYQSCAHEASKLKKIAHRKWWHLQSEVTSCKDHRQKVRLRKQMQQLELVWGPSS
jgi:hypothetical protein